MTDGDGNIYTDPAGSSPSMTLDVNDLHKKQNIAYHVVHFIFVVRSGKTRQMFAEIIKIILKLLCFSLFFINFDNM